MSRHALPHLNLALLIALPLAQGAAADQVFMDDVIVDETLLCVGTECVNGETEIFGREGIKLKGDALAIKFVDTSTGLNIPSRDWQLEMNENAVGGLNAFFIRDTTQNSQPFAIEGGITGRALHIAQNGNIGLSTTLPQAELHIVDGDRPKIRLEQDGSNGFAARTWDIIANESEFAVRDETSIRTPFRIKSTAPHNALYIAEDGNVGFGTDSPAAQIELSRASNFNFFRITATAADVNKNVDIVFTEGPLGTGQLRYNIVEGADAPQVPEMTLDADGNMVLTGTLTTAGPTCAGGCDRVFDTDYPLPSISDHTQDMWTLGHLPAIGPTTPNAAVNVTEKLGNVINELEHAHIYIGQLHAQNAQLQSDVKVLKARMEEVVGLLTELTAGAQ